MRGGDEATAIVAAAEARGAEALRNASAGEGRWLHSAGVRGSTLRRRCPTIVPGHAAPRAEEGTQAAMASTAEVGARLYGEACLPR